MRRFLIPMIATASALSIAAPAAAQWAPPVYNYTPYNYNRGFSGLNFARSMEARVQRIRMDVRAMQAQRVLSWREARSLEVQARNLQRRIAIASRNGIGPFEARNLENGIFRLERRVARQASIWNNRRGHIRRF